MQQRTWGFARVVAGTQGSSQVAAWDLGFQSGHGWEHGVPLKLEGTQGSFRVAAGPPLELSWGDSSLAGMCRVEHFLLQCAGGYSLVLAWDFSSCVEPGILYSCSVWASYCGGICFCRAQVLGHVGFSSCGKQTESLWHMSSRMCELQ